MTSIPLQNQPLSEKSSFLSCDDESTKSSKSKILGKKTEREKINENNLKIENVEKWTGKTISNRAKGIHSKFKEDNMILKIKNFLFNSILFSLNNSLIYNYQNDRLINPKLKFQFLKIDCDKNYAIDKDTNLNLLKTKVKDLLNENISEKYKIINKNNNKELIKKIYEEKKEINVINILELTYGEFLDMFRGTNSSELKNKMLQNIKEKCNMEIFLEKIRRQEIGKGEPTEKVKWYLERLKDLCLNFEKWFENKKGRSRKKSIGNGH